MGHPLDQAKRHTEAELFAIPEDERFHELLAGEIVRKASPSGRHGGAQFKLCAAVGPYDRRSSGPGPAGWIFATETETRLAPDSVVRPDVAGWRRERLPRMPDTMPVLVAPDWVCEILSRSNAKTDLWDKLSLYHEARVLHYWILDPDREWLRVHRWADTGYQVVLEARSPAVVRAEPFDLIDLSIAELFDKEETEQALAGRSRPPYNPNPTLP